MYDQDKFMTIVLPEWDFGDGASVDAMAFRLPPGFVGNVVSIGVAVTETFACDNTAALLEVGSTDGGGEYAALAIADAAADKDFFDQTDDTDAILTHTGEAQIAEGSLFYVSGTVGIDAGTEAGKGLGTIVIRMWR
jgi:hypothetical protein